MANDKYEILTARHPGFARAFRRRVARNDTLADLQFWIRTRYGVAISHETIRAWRVKYGQQ